MARRFSRRSTRQMEDLPSLFDNTDKDENVQFKVVAEDKKTAMTAVDEYAVAEEFTRRKKGLRFISFGSGSSGNCSYIGTSTCGFLIDGGVDNNFVTKELARAGIDISTIKGIFLTHDHADHVRFSYALLRRNPHMRLYATARTIDGILRRHNISRRIKDYHTPIYKEHEYTFDGITILPFETSHDGTDNCGFYVTFNDFAFSIATDMGMITPRADYYMRRSNALVIESNYDDQMLTEGRYTEHLKARIRSNTGHMENSVTAKYLTDIYTRNLSHIFLCHLSEDNNTPETALATSLNALRTIEIRPAVSSAEIPEKTVFITPLPRYTSSELYIF